MKEAIIFFREDDETVTTRAVLVGRCGDSTALVQLSDGTPRNIRVELIRLFSPQAGALYEALFNGKPVGTVLGAAEKLPNDTRIHIFRGKR